MWWKTKFEKFDKSKTTNILDTIEDKRLLSIEFSYESIQSLSEDQRLALLCYWNNELNNSKLTNVEFDVALSNHKWLTSSLNDSDSDKTWYNKYTHFVTELIYDVDDSVEESIDETLLTGMINRDKYEQLTEEEQLIVMFWQLDNYLNCAFEDPDYYMYENNYYVMTETLNKGVCKRN